MNKSIPKKLTASVGVIRRWYDTTYKSYYNLYAKLDILFDSANVCVLFYPKRGMTLPLLVLTLQREFKKSNE